jgi:transcriptional regulator with XRE-family HTH domain
MRLGQNEETSGPRTATAVDREIGSRIRARRLELGMSQEGLADALGVTFQQVQKYEKGINRVAASTLIAIARVLDVQLTALIPRAGKASASQIGVDDETYQSLIAYYSKLNPAGRRLLVASAKSLLAEGHLRNKKS